jgi:hypothetical protein
MPVGEAVGSGDVQEVPLKERGVNGAAMRDDGFFFATDTLPQLEQEMTAEITKRAPDAEAGDGRQHLAEYLGPDLAARFGLTDPGTVHGHDEDDDNGLLLGDDERFLLAAMQAAFPAWTIEYSSHARAWIARTRKKTICEPSAVLLCAALLLIERRARQASDPGPGPG